MKKLIFLFFVCSVTLVYSQQNEQSVLKQNNIQMLQPITVTLGGDFIVNGSFTAIISDRVDHFITTIYTEAQQKALTPLNQLEMIKILSKELNKFALRDIKLKRASGEVINIDLLKFRLTGNFKYNPYLNNDDVLIFPSLDPEKGLVEISGAVNKLAKFQFVEGDKLSDAILFAGGINLAYDNVITAEISRLSERGDKEELIKVSIKDDYLLKRGDRIRILFDENNRKIFKVLVLGEVKEPGYVYITKDNTTLKDVINKVGGFTPKAWLERSELIRGTSESDVLKMNAIRDNYENDKNFNSMLTEKFLNKLFVEQMKFVRMNDRYAEDSLSVIIDNSLRVLQGKSLIDFTKVDSDSSSDGKYIVRNEDIIVIPQKEDLVYVFGQVKNPGYVKYEPKKNRDFYISKAGGKGERAESDIKVIKGNALTWVTSNIDTEISAGDMIYVPKDIPKPFEYYLRSVSSIATIIMAISTVILTIIQSNK
jgi:protein involved in polysaccharide export with SLBB domain